MVHRNIVLLFAILTGCGAARTTSSATASTPAPVSAPRQSPPSALAECVEPPRGVPFGIVLSCRQPECPGRYLVGEMGEMARLVDAEAIDTVLRQEATAHADREWLVTATGELDEDELRDLAARAAASGLSLATACLPLPDWNVTAEGRLAHLPIARELIRSGAVLGGADVPERSRDAIRVVIRQHLDEVLACYEQSRERFQEGHEPRGRVRVAFIVAPDGAVVASEVAESSLGDDLIEACTANAVTHFRFAPSPDGGHVLIHYPFVLEPE